MILSIVVVSAKSTSDARNASPFPPDPNSPQSTISTVEREIREAGGDATAIPVDVRDFDNIKKLVDKTIEVHMHFRSPTSFTLKLNCQSCTPN